MRAEDRARAPHHGADLARFHTCDDCTCDHSIFALIEGAGHPAWARGARVHPGQAKEILRAISAFLVNTVRFGEFAVVLAGRIFHADSRQQHREFLNSTSTRQIHSLQIPLLAGVSALLFRARGCTTPSTWCSSHISRETFACCSWVWSRRRFSTSPNAPISRSRLRSTWGCGGSLRWRPYSSIAAGVSGRSHRAVIGGVLAQVNAMTVIVSCIWVYAQFAYS